MSTNQYDWVEFYKEFAHKLMAYKDNRQELITKVESIYGQGDRHFVPELNKNK